MNETRQGRVTVIGSLNMDSSRARRACRGRAKHWPDTLFRRCRAAIRPSQLRVWARKWR